MRRLVILLINVVIIPLRVRLPPTQEARYETRRGRTPTIAQAAAAGEVVE